ncbi:MAG: YqgE/AlgH family protein [Pseudomonadota bacterium]
MQVEALAPGFLIAAPMLKDPNFDHAVVLVCLRNEEGAMGLVINRPSPFTITDIFEQIGIEFSLPITKHVMVGGPVEMQSGLLLYEVDSDSGIRAEELPISDTLRLCPDRAVLQEIGKGKGPVRFQMYLGHAGWGPGQLESELAQGVWIPGRVHPELIFSSPSDNCWERALGAEGLDSTMLSSFTTRA